jgi:glycosyltransferase involved in cell wall biosynthesis
MWNGKTVSVVVPAYNEEATVRQIVEEVLRDAPVDEVIVVNNNSTDRTVEEASKTPARILFEPRPGYGFALRKGLESAKGDHVVLFDADGNFVASDIGKLLAYTDCFDFVKGTRSRPELVEDGIYSPFLSWLVLVANIAVSKFQQFVFRGPVLTDAGCTLRLIKSDTLRKLLPFITVGGGHFQADLTNLAMIKKTRMIEVPVRFTKRRGGYSKYGTVTGLTKVALNMILLTVRQRILAFSGYYGVERTRFAEPSREVPANRVQALKCAAGGAASETSGSNQPPGC